MNINQNNYETFFLLYVDNELSTAERLCVEAFIQEHPYLEKEFRLLQGMVLPAEDSILGDKAMLYRSAAIDGNVQEAMLLYLDGELADPGKRALENKIAAEEQVLTSWELLKKTKLQADDVVIFPGKQLLYRRDSARIVYLRFTKWAVAAALIAAGFYAGVTLVNQQDEKETTVAKADANKPENTGSITAKDDKALDPATKLIATKPEAKLEAPSGVTKKTPGLAGAARKNPDYVTGNNSIQKTGEYLNASRTEPKQGIPVKIILQQPAIAANNGKLNIEKPEIQEVSTVLASVAERPKPKVEITDRNTRVIENSFARNGLLEEPEQTGNHILFMNQEDVARSKAGIFFKKLKRTVARSTNIKTGNSLKIAGFEFAVK